MATVVAGVNSRCKGGDREHSQAIAMASSQHHTANDGTAHSPKPHTHSLTHSLPSQHTINHFHEQTVNTPSYLPACCVKAEGVVELEHQ